MPHQCAAITAKGRPCPHAGSRLWYGVRFCHVHDPNGEFQANERAKGPKPPKARRRSHQTRDPSAHLYACNPVEFNDHGVDAPFVAGFTIYDEIRNGKFIIRGGKSVPITDPSSGLDH